MPRYMQHIVRYAAHMDIDPLSLDTFQGIVKKANVETEDEMLVAFFVAIKFEEIYYPMWADVADALGKSYITKATMESMERNLLYKLSFIIPYHTPIREWVNSFPEAQPLPLAAKKLMYAVLYAGIANMYTGEQWFDIYLNAINKQPVPLQLVFLLSSKRVMADTPFTAFPRRLKRKMDCDA